MQYKTTIRKEGAADQTRVIEADSRFAVYDQVQKEGGTVVNIVDGGGGLRVPAWFNITIGTGVKRAELIQMTKNISAMLTAGLPLSRALSVIERQSGNKRFKAIIGGLSESIKKGTSFHEALGKYPKVFPEIFIAMTRAGEESGSLADALLIVGVQMEHSEELGKKVRGAMIYPCVVLTAVLIVGILMLIYVVPTLTHTFTELGVKLPMATQVIVMVSNFMSANAITVLLGLVVLIFGAVSFLRSKTGGNAVVAFAIHMPVVGELVKETYTARASRTLSSLLSSGVPVLDALSITKDVVHIKKYAAVVEEAEVRVKKGDPLSSAFAEHTKLYPILMSEMLLVGEETGQVAQMLKQIAEFYEEDVSQKTKDLSTIIEPLLLLVIGAGVGVFAVSIIAPIYSLSSAF